MPCYWLHGLAIAQPTAMIRAMGLAAFVGVLAVASPVRANAITNSSFETGNFADWTTQIAPSGSLLLVGGRGHSGAAAWFGAMGGKDDGLSQTFATLPGESYLVTFWLGHGATDTANAFSVWWENTPLLALTNSSRFGQHRYSFVTTAQDDETTLRFSGRELLDFYYLDDVSVVGVPRLETLTALATPEPATLSLLLGGALALAGRAHRSRRRRTAAGTRLHAEGSPAGHIS